jgi:hypothetical protein
VSFGSSSRDLGRGAVEQWHNSPNREELARRNETIHRPWACSQTISDVLEVAIGAGLNLPVGGNLEYGDEVMRGQALEGRRAM